MSALALAAVLAMPMPMPMPGDGTPAPNPAPAPGSRSFVVGMKDKLFRPGALDMVLGDKVTWNNDDGATHTVTSAASGFDSGRMAPGMKFAFSPTAQGTISYHCSLHFFMTGHIDVHGLGLDTPGGAARPGAPVTLKGRAPQGVSEVALEQRAADGTWSAATHAVPAADGSFSVAITPTTPVVVRARSGDLLSRDVTVSAAPEVMAHASRRGGRIVVHVMTMPAQPRARIRLDYWKWERFDWRPAASGRLDARSEATMVLRSAARRRLRVVVTRGVRGYGGGTSTTMHVGRLRRR